MSNIEKYVYSKMGEKYKKNSKNIKNNVLKAIDYMFIETQWEKIRKYFLLQEEKKPTPKQIINTIIMRIQE